MFKSDLNRCGVPTSCHELNSVERGGGRPIPRVAVGHFGDLVKTWLDGLLEDGLMGC